MSYTDISNNIPAFEQSRQIKFSEPVVETVSVSAKIDKAVSQRDPSELIGEKLIIGWALLDETCPSEACVNIIPLLRDKSGEVCS